MNLTAATPFEREVVLIVHRSGSGPLSPRSGERVRERGPRGFASASPKPCVLGEASLHRGHKRDFWVHKLGLSRAIVTSTNRATVRRWIRRPSVDIALARRRALRRNSTDAEAALWAHLRAKRFAGFKFRRQHPCGPYILDFYCPDRRLAIELDGGKHFELEAQAYDARRTAYLRRRGIQVIRFPCDLVFRELPSVLDTIVLALGLVGPSP